MCQPHKLNMHNSRLLLTCQSCLASPAAWDHCLPTKSLGPTHLDPSDLPVDHVDLHFVQGPAFKVIFVGKASGMRNQGCQGLGRDKCCKGDVHIQGQPRLAGTHRLVVPHPHLQSSKSRCVKDCESGNLAAHWDGTRHVNHLMALE